MMRDREALDVPDAATAAGISRSKLYALIREGEGPRTFKVGRRRLVRRQALQAWLEQLESEQLESEQVRAA